MKKNFKGLLAIWMAAAMMLAMMLPAAAAMDEAPIEPRSFTMWFSTTGPDEGVFDQLTYIGFYPFVGDSLLEPDSKLSDLFPSATTLPTHFKVWFGMQSSGAVGPVVKNATGSNTAYAADTALSDVLSAGDYTAIVLQPTTVSNEGGEGTTGGDTIPGGTEKEESSSRGGAFLLFWFFHDVDFVIDEETTETVSVRYGDCIVAPEVTAPEGYEFTGWYTDADCTEAFDLETKFRSDVIREVEILYAGYAPIAAEEIEDAE